MITATITLLSPLVHGSFDAGDIGNATPIRRLPIVSLPGNPEVPCLSGNAIRGRMRRVVMRDLFDRCGLSRETPELAGTWDRLYAALANGGHVEASEASVRPEDVRTLRAALPPLSAFGSALYSWMLPGRCRVGWCWPVCAETVEAGLVSDPGDLRDAESLVHEVGLVRHIDRTEQDPAVSGVTPMPTTTETLSTGARLACRIQFDPDATAVERAVVAYGLDRIRHLGGKSGAGFGEVEIAHDGDASAYVAWLVSPEQDARTALLGLAAGMGRKAKRAGK